jgi:hypothetical protein
MKLIVHSSDVMFASSGRRRSSLAMAELVSRLLGLLFLVAFVAGTAAGSDIQSAPVSSVDPGLPLAIADFDGDLHPDLARVQIGRSEVGRTDYWIQFQLSGTGRQTIRVIAPAGGLQIAARDVNGDHAPDLVLTTSWFREPVAILLNDGHGSFSRVDPTAFPEAFTESETSWGSSPLQAPDAVGVPPQSRAGIFSTTARLPHAGSQVGAILASNCRFPFSAFLISHPGRAPPSEASQL